VIEAVRRYNRAMRVWVIAASITWFGCRFSSPSAAGDDAVSDDAPVDAAPDAYVAACMTDPTYSPHGGHSYKAYPAPNVDYDTAIDRCTADGAHLAVVDSMEESEYLRTLVNTDAWIGLDDLTIENTFRWVTGATSSYRRFNTSEPNNNNGEDCVYVRSDGTWNDTACEDSKRVLCECDPAYRPPPTPACRALPGATTRSGRKYFKRTPARTWQEAEDDCKSIGAHLLVIGDTDENTELDGAFSGASWIGYTDAVTEGQFQWVDGSPSTFHSFGATVPTNDGQDCAALQDGGAWTDLACDTILAYACECDPLPP